MPRKTLTSQGAVEGLADTGVHRLARPAQVQLDAVPVRPASEGG
jgi:hypothetical protein